MNLALVFALALLAASPSFAEDKTSFEGRSFPSGETTIARHIILIHDDSGGVVKEYVKRFDSYAKNQDTVIVDGLCWSACTYVLRVPNACATENGVFAFQQAFFTSRDSLVTAFKLNNMSMFLYPPHIQRELIRRGGLSNKWLFVHAPELLPLCNG